MSPFEKLLRETLAERLAQATWSNEGRVLPPLAEGLPQDEPVEDTPEDVPGGER